MFETPLVSVIIPVYNAEQYLCECLESVVNQTLREIEIICVDDGSTDDSLPVIRKLQKKDSRISVLLQEHKGAGAARNLGLAHAKGQYLAFLDADDYFDPQLLEKGSGIMVRESTDIVVFRAYEHNQKTGRIAPMPHS